ncbi:hypothetical protein GIS00_13500 [Nakamurella sp. YIM 132087]|uniref:DUF5709 domain-containing protein n=1 Tax=Nakamurella alba TaxID=2665158 RepID=A0A7K1FLD5_9ACTN|nr:hypothetical protein [Nakamurella alba]MTD14955.1 hypothetical protein [Nakamurella alba]
MNDPTTPRTPLDDDSAAAYDTTGPDGMGGPGTGGASMQDEVTEADEDDPGEGLFLDDEPLFADDAPLPEPEEDDTMSTGHQGDDLPDTAAEEHDVLAADEDARDRAAADDGTGPGSSGLLPEPAEFADRLEVDPDGDVKG